MEKMIVEDVDEETDGDEEIDEFEYLTNWDLDYDEDIYSSL